MRKDQQKIDKLRNSAQASQWPAKKKKTYSGYLDNIRANNKALCTQCIYAANIKSLGDFITQKEFEDYSEAGMVAYKTSLKEKDYAPYSVHNHMLDCQTFIKWCLQLENGEKPAYMKWYQVKLKSIAIAQGGLIAKPFESKILLQKSSGGSPNLLELNEAEFNKIKEAIELKKKELVLG